MNVKVIFNLPWQTSRWILEHLSGFRHPRQQIYSRFVKFMNSLFTNKRSIVRSLFNSVHSDVRSHIGTNIRKIETDTGVVIVPGVTKPHDLRHYVVYPAPEHEEWRIELLQCLLEIKEDSWTVIFNEEGGDEEVELFGDNDIELMIIEACSSS